MSHVPRGQELPFFEVYGFAGPGGGDNEVGLAAEQGRDLQQIEDGGGGLRLRRFMDIRGHGNAQPSPYAPENRKAFLETGTAIRMKRGSIGFIERRLEDVRKTELSAKFGHLTADFEAVVLALYDARTGDHEQGRRPAFRPQKVEGVCPALLHGCLC
jgi:hypothetical protein